jgi:hypothetical protein
MIEDRTRTNNVTKPDIYSPLNTRQILTGLGINLPKDEFKVQRIRNSCK